MSGLRVGVLAALAAIVVVMWGLAFVSKRFEHVAAGVAALEPREFETLSLVAVGSGGTFENPWRLGPSVAVARGETVLLVDAGRAVAEALRAARIPVSQPRDVFLTSLLPENVVGLDDLWLTGWLGPRDAPLRVHGPPGTAALVARLAEAHRQGAEALGGEWSLPPEGGGIEAVELRDGAVVERDGLRVVAHETAGGALPALAYRVEADGRALVVAGVDADAERLAALARDADLLAVDAVVGASLEAAEEAEVERLDVIQAEARRHLLLEDVGEVARRAGVGTLVLLRLRPPPVFDFQYRRIVGEQFRGRVVIASDGEVVTP